MSRLDTFAVRRLGPATHASPLQLATTSTEGIPRWVDDDVRVLAEIEVSSQRAEPPPATFEKAGPRARLYFDPARTHAAIVTCGGLAPGLNNVIRSLVLELHHRYGVRRVTGFRYGFEGLTTSGVPPVALDPEAARAIHLFGGTSLGTSRGPQDPEEMARTLLDRKVDVLFGIGGDGTMRALHAISGALARRGAKVAVIGIPKTIDNDILHVDQTFGFETACEIARQAIAAAHTEAIATRNGVGLVKLMGRDAGFIAAHATVASRDVNACLIPEAPLSLEGEGGFYAWLVARLRARGHAVVVVAEGCAARLRAAAGAARDASGNIRYELVDVGHFLRDGIHAHLAAQNLAFALKYVDPSYMIRGVPANALDAALADTLARHAVHAAMAGRTDVLVGRAHRVFTHVPLEAVLEGKRIVDTTGALWLAVLEATGQPRFSGAAG